MEDTEVPTAPSTPKLQPVQPHKRAASDKLIESSAVRARISAGKIVCAICRRGDVPKNDVTHFNACWKRLRDQTQKSSPKGSIDPNPNKKVLPGLTVLLERLSGASSEMTPKKEEKDKSEKRDQKTTDLSPPTPVSDSVLPSPPTKLPKCALCKLDLSRMSESEACFHLVACISAYKPKHCRLCSDVFELGCHPFRYKANRVRVIAVIAEHVHNCQLKQAPSQAVTMKMQDFAHRWDAHRRQAERLLEWKYNAWVKRPRNKQRERYVNKQEEGKRGQLDIYHLRGTPLRCATSLLENDEWIRTVHERPILQSSAGVALRRFQRTSFSIVAALGGRQRVRDKVRVRSERELARWRREPEWLEASSKPGDWLVKAVLGPSSLSSSSKILAFLQKVKDSGALIRKILSEQPQSRQVQVRLPHLVCPELSINFNCEPCEPTSQIEQGSTTSGRRSPEPIRLRSTEAAVTMPSAPQAVFKDTSPLILLDPFAHTIHFTDRSPIVFSEGVVAKPETVRQAHDILDRGLLHDPPTDGGD